MSFEVKREIPFRIFKRGCSIVHVCCKVKQLSLVVSDGKTTEFPVQRLPAESVVDTNGAGDSFVGGFLSQLIKGEPLSVCIECGVWAAQHIIQVSGCTLVGKPSFKPSSSNYS